MPIVMLNLGGFYIKTRQPKANGQDDERNTSKNSAASFSKKSCFILKNVRDLGLLEIFN